MDYSGFGAIVYDGHLHVVIVQVDIQKALIIDRREFGERRCVCEKLGFDTAQQTARWRALEAIDATMNGQIVVV